MPSYPYLHLQMWKIENFVPFSDVLDSSIVLIQTRFIIRLFDFEAIR